MWVYITPFPKPNDQDVKLRFVDVFIGFRRFFSWIHDIAYWAFAQ